MDITYNNGEMIVTHPSGHIDKYDQVDIEQRKAKVQKRIDERKELLVFYSEIIVAIQNSLGA